MNALRLQLGDWVEFEDERHQVTGFAGTAVRLRSESGTAQLILTAELLADASFQSAVADPRETAELTLDCEALLAEVDTVERRRVLAMEAHLLESTTGYRSGNPVDPIEGEPRPDFRPELTQRQRVAAKAVELGISERRLWQLLDGWRRFGL